MSPIGVKKFRSAFPHFWKNGFSNSIAQKNRNEILYRLAQAHKDEIPKFKIYS